MAKSKVMTLNETIRLTRSNKRSNPGNNCVVMLLITDKRALMIKEIKNKITITTIMAKVNSRLRINSINPNFDLCSISQIVFRAS